MPKKSAILPPTHTHKELAEDARQELPLKAGALKSTTDCTRDELIRSLFDEYIEMYATRDDRLTARFSENFSGYTGGGSFIVKDRDEWVKITRLDFSQVTGHIRIEMLDLAMQDLNDNIVVVTALFHIHLPIPDHILSREAARLVLIFRREIEDWKIVHSGISIPYHGVQDGEVYPIKGLNERNRELEILVETRTRALEEANSKVLKLNAELEEKVQMRTAALGQAMLDLEQSSCGKDEFLAAISHELKTPLNHILGFADLLKEGIVGELSAEQKELAQNIFDAGSKQLEIVNSLIKLARLQAGKVTLQTKPEEPLRFLGEIAARYADKAQASRLDFAVDVAEDMGEMQLDREVVTSLLDQLLANALKFTPSGGKVSLSARRVLRKDVIVPVQVDTDKYLELTVADNGHGIAPEILPLLFQPFMQGDGRLTRSYGGTGVGLILVKLLAELHGGGCGVQSKPGVGTKFLVWLPIGMQQQ